MAWQAPAAIPLALDWSFSSKKDWAKRVQLRPSSLLATLRHAHPLRPPVQPRHRHRGITKLRSSRCAIVLFVREPRRWNITVQESALPMRRMVCAQPHYVADLFAVECSISKSYSFTHSEVRSHRVFKHTWYPVGCQATLTCTELRSDLHAARRISPLLRRRHLRPSRRRHFRPSCRRHFRLSGPLAQKTLKPDAHSQRVSIWCSARHRLLQTRLVARHPGLLLHLH